jgi:hypothetical protein
MIVNGDNSPSLNDGTDFGLLVIGSPEIHTFDIDSNGTASLSLSGLSVPTGFSINTAPDPVVPPGSSTSFSIEINPSSSGIYGGLVHFTTNTLGKNPFDFNITARVNDSDNIDFEIENQVPNAVGNGTGDGNGDGIADMNQGSVASLLNYDGNGWITISNSQNYQTTDIQTLPAPDDAPEGLIFPYGMFEITVKGLPVDGSGSVTLSIFVPYNTAITEYWKKDKNGKWTDLNATIEHIGTSKTKITFTLKDNGIFDLDPSDGTIVDPGGPTISAAITTTVPALGTAGRVILVMLLMAGALIFKRKS